MARSKRAVPIELGIVVFGILIALGVDRLMEGRKDRAMEATYLEALAGDISADTAALTHVVEEAEGHRDAANRILDHLERASSDVTYPASLAWDINYAGYTNFFRPTDYTYRDLLSTGGLGLVKDAELRRMIIAYYSRIGYVEQFYDAWSEAPRERYNPQVERILAPSDWRIIESSTIESRDDGLSVESVIRTLRSSNPVRNSLVTIAVSAEQQVGAMENLRTQAVELLVATEGTAN